MKPAENYTLCRALNDFARSFRATIIPIFCSILFLSPVSAFADDVKIAEIASKTLIRDTLRNDLVQIQKEKSRCDREKKNWKIATIAGAVGVATTATIGVVQYNKQQDLKTQITQ